MEDVSNLSVANSMNNDGEEAAWWNRIGAHRERESRLALDLGRPSGLDHTAVNTLWRHVIWHIQEPDALPNVIE
jgi:hypothetical protein